MEQLVERGWYLKLYADMVDENILFTFLRVVSKAICLS